MTDLAFDLRQELGHSLRALTRRPTFTCVAAAVLALGIGANTAIFSLVNALLLRPLMAADPERLVTVHSVSKDGSGFHAFSFLDFRDYREESPALEVAAWSTAGVSLSTGEEARFALGQIVSENFFDVFGVAPAAGRFFGPADAEPVAVLGYGLWQKLGGGADVLGRTIHVNQEPTTVVGVAPEGFTGAFGAVSTEVWVPLSMQPQVQPDVRMDDRAYVWLEMVGRLAPGVDRSQAEAWLETRFRQLVALRPGSGDAGVELGEPGVVPGQVRGAAAGFLGVLMGVVALVLLITSVNVAGMLLARAAERRREIALRLAIGAGRGRLIRHLVSESLLLFALGGAAGTLLAQWALRLLLTVKLPIPASLALDLGLDYRVLAFTLATTFFVGVAFGLAPAFQATRVDLVSSLKEDGGTGGGRRLGGRRAFVIVQVAGVLVLLIAAGLFLRALSRAATIDPGFKVQGLHLATVDLALHGYSEEAGRAFYASLVERLGERPDVEATSVGRVVPLGPGNSGGAFNVPGVEPPPDDSAYSADTTTVGAGYFRTLRIPLLAGRGFLPRDRDGSEPVAVVNAAIAERFWPDGGAVGRTIVWDGTERTVVGVAATGKYRTLGETPRFFVYLPFAQSYSPQMTLFVRGAGGVEAAMREEIRGLDRHLPVLGLQPMSDYVRLSLLPQRIASILAGAFALLGLVLVAIGLYGVTAFTVTQRTRELGLRMALGATRRQVFGLVLGQGVRTTLVGVAIGLGGAFVLTRALASLLYGLSATDPAVFLGAPLLLFGIVLVGCLVPARRATEIEPLRALRYE